MSRRGLQAVLAAIGAVAVVAGVRDATGGTGKMSRQFAIPAAIIPWQRSLR